MKAFWKRMKWVVISVAAAIGVVVAFLLRGMVVKEDSSGKREDVLPRVNEKLKERVVRAEEEALVARVEAKAKADVQREQLEQIGKIEDGVERRRRLAGLLRDL